jgi:hypothetical protein
VGIGVRSGGAGGFVDADGLLFGFEVFESAIFDVLFAH